MLTFIDNLLNRITMYRLMLYFVFLLNAVAIVFSFAKILPYEGRPMLETLAVLTISCLVANKILSKIFRVQTNVESDFITAWILALIITPGSPVSFLIWVAVFSQASKYILTYRGKQIFNPAAIGVVATFLTLNQAASWWVGDVHLLPFVVVGGLLVVRKIQRFHLVFSFLIAWVVVIAYTNSEVAQAVRSSLQNSALLYFAFVMLTEPATSPPTTRLRMIYGVLIGLLFGLNFQFGPFYPSFELALVLGNIFSFIASPRVRYKLTLIAKHKIAEGIYDFVFAPNYEPKFKPGQYLEWTLESKGADLRGNRRYFTIASSPTEEQIHLGVRFYDPPSTFKQKLLALNPGQQIFAGQLAGDFVLPKDKKKKLVFMASGIGITPFRSMLKYLTDNFEQRSVTVFYANKNESEIAFKDVLDKANDILGIKIVYINSEKDGLLTADRIAKEVGDYKNSSFYLSGSRGSVLGFEGLVKSLGVSSRQIKKDFFPGYA